MSKSIFYFALLILAWTEAPTADLACWGESIYLKATVKATARSLERAQQTAAVGKDIQPLCVDLQTFEKCSAGSSSVLRGYRVAGNPIDGHDARGAVLVAPGNGMAARSLLDSFDSYADQGFDIFIFDYRGHGESTGDARLDGMVSDYRKTIDVIRNSPAYAGKPLIVHGISHGGVVASNAMDVLQNSTYLVLDAVPAEIPSFKFLFIFPIFSCKSEFDPVSRIQNYTDRLGQVVVVIGRKDKQIRPRQSRDLVKIVGEASPISGVHDSLAHPFSQKDNSDTRSELYREIATYVLDSERMRGH